jgi:16S rRNA (uracil1498-N3)-methyltransferase
VKHTFRYVVARELAPGEDVALPAGDVHHLLRVVRRRVGDPLELIDAAGRIWPATVAQIDPACTVRVGDAPRPAPAPLALDLIVGLAEPGRLDLVVEKAAELGVRSVTIVRSERARRAPSPDAFATRLARLARMAEGAARQSGNPAPTAVRGLVAFSDVIDTDESPGVILDARAEIGLQEVLAGGSGPIRIAVGPDTGWSPAEVDRARAAGWTVAGLGEMTLRMETAAIAACVLAASARGRLGT